MMRFLAMLDLKKKEDSQSWVKLIDNDPFLETAARCPLNADRKFDEREFLERLERIVSQLQNGSNP